jgi:hypothetical protein
VRSYLDLVAPSPLALAKALARGAALEDLSLTLPAARVAVRLLSLAARDHAGRVLAEAAGQALDEATILVRRLRGRQHQACGEETR